MSYTHDERHKGEKLLFLYKTKGFNFKGHGIFCSRSVVIYNNQFKVTDDNELQLVHYKELICYVKKLQMHMHHIYMYLSGAVHHEQRFIYMIRDQEDFFLFKYSIRS